MNHSYKRLRSIPKASGKKQPRNLSKSTIPTWTISGADTSIRRFGPMHLEGCTHLSKQVGIQEGQSALRLTHSSVSRSEEAS